jgi:hypothetical protein
MLSAVAVSLGAQEEMIPRAEELEAVKATAQIMLMAFGGLFFVAVTGFVVINQMLNPESLARRFPPPMTNDKRKKSILSFFHTFRLLQAAVLEGCALFGAVIILLHNKNGLIEENPMLWLGLCGPVLMTIFVVTNFPGEERLGKLLADSNQAAEYQNPT